MNRVVLFGDSITAGVTDGYPTRRLTVRLEQQLPAVDFLNRGIPGDYTTPALTRFNVDVLAANPTLVVIFFGTNDVKHISQHDFIANLTQMLHTLQLLHITPVLITPGITGTNAQEHRPNTKLAHYAAAEERLATAFGVPIVKWHQVMAAHPAAQMLQADGIHYSSAAYDLLCRHLVPVIKASLPQPTIWFN